MQAAVHARRASMRLTGNGIPSMLSVLSAAGPVAEVVHEEEALPGDRRVSVTVMHGVVSGTPVGARRPRPRLGTPVGDEGRTLTAAMRGTLSYVELLNALEAERAALLLLEEGAAVPARVLQVVTAPEVYLTPAECQRVLEYTPAAFAALPAWKRRSMRAKARLQLNVGMVASVAVA